MIEDERREWAVSNGLENGELKCHRLPVLQQARADFLENYLLRANSSVTHPKNSGYDREEFSHCGA
jgi:hypothetical protein